jgi:hypothetical protein
VSRLRAVGTGSAVEYYAEAFADAGKALALLNRVLLHGVGPESRMVGGANNVKNRNHDANRAQAQKNGYPPASADG